MDAVAATICRARGTPASGATVRCPACGAEASGNYCARCGSELAEDPATRCPACGAPADDGALFCAECGEPLRPRPEKSVGDYLPWILSALALVAFSVGIAIFVQERSSPRGPGRPVTGGVVSGGGARMEGADPTAPGGATDTASDGPASGMPGADELAAMPPREAADRLFNRAMRLAEAGDGSERAPFFARMGVRAYRRVPADSVDADLRFHVGLLQLVDGDADAARAEADTILSRDPAHLLGLLLAARAADAAGDPAAARRWRDSLRATAGRSGFDARPEYRAHRQLLREALER